MSFHSYDNKQLVPYYYVLVLIDATLVVSHTVDEHNASSDHSDRHIRLFDALSLPHNNPCLTSVSHTGFEPVNYNGFEPLAYAILLVRVI